jgi:hypothetical protein
MFHYSTLRDEEELGVCGWVLGEMGLWGGLEKYGSGVKMVNLWGCSLSFYLAIYMILSCSINPNPLNFRCVCQYSSGSQQIALTCTSFRLNPTLIWSNEVTILGERI